ncbi:MAG TPA: ferrous iron transport protein A [Firmicutes bacterium]|jgi:ferrous iron transport protein A|nr:ferrous iron transport protein A [Bacillota bacterium]HBK61871.1 ferrous iron transport protein A [Bacillota bacterium]
MENAHDREPGAIALSDLHMGQTGIIRSVLATGMARSRLLDLGFLFGTRVTAVRRAPLGDPTAFTIRGAMLALRAQDASLVTVTPVDSPQMNTEAGTGAGAC